MAEKRQFGTPGGMRTFELDRVPQEGEFFSTTPERYDLKVVRDGKMVDVNPNQYFKAKGFDLGQDPTASARLGVSDATSIFKKFSEDVGFDPSALNVYNPGDIQMFLTGQGGGTGELTEQELSALRGLTGQGQQVDVRDAQGDVPFTREQRMQIFGEDRNFNFGDVQPGRLLGPTEFEGLRKEWTQAFSNAGIRDINVINDAIEKNFLARRGGDIFLKQVTPSIAEVVETARIEGRPQRSAVDALPEAPRGTVPVDSVSIGSGRSIADMINNIRTQTSQETASAVDQIIGSVDTDLGRAKAQRQGLLDKLTQLGTESLTDDIRGQMEEQKVTQLETELSDIQKQIAKEKESLQLGILQESQRISPMGLIGRRQRVLEQRGMARIGTLAAIADVVQGNLGSAMQKVDLFVNALDKDRQNEIRSYETLLSYKDKEIIDLTRKEEAEVQAQIEAIKAQQEQLQKNKDDVFALLTDKDTAVAAAKAGVSLLDSREEAMRKLSGYYRTQQDSAASADIDTWANSIIAGNAKISNVPTDMRTQVNARVGQIAATSNLLTPAQKAQREKIIDNLRAEPAYKDMNAVQNGYQSVDVGYGRSDSFGDLTMVNGFQRMIDPGAVVREGEFATVRDAQGLLQKVLGTADRWISGDQLTQAGRQRMKAVADELYREKARTFNQTVGAKYRGIANSEGIPLSMVGAEFDVPVRSYGDLRPLDKTYGTLEDLVSEFPEYLDLTEDLLADPDKEYTDQEVLQILQGQAFSEDLSMSEDGSVDKIAQAIGQFESGGNYQARGPVVQSGMYAGERAMGKYQIMPGNLPQWSREALGREVTEQEFMSNPQLQDQIAMYHMGKIFDQYGTVEDVASVWFSGQPLAKGRGRRDVLGTEVGQYARNVRSIFDQLS